MVTAIYLVALVDSGQHTSLYYDDPSSNANEANIF